MKPRRLTRANDFTVHAVELVRTEEGRVLGVAIILSIVETFVAFLSLLAASVKTVGWKEIIDSRVDVINGSPIIVSTTVTAVVHVGLVRLLHLALGEILRLLLFPQETHVKLIEGGADALREGTRHREEKNGDEEEDRKHLVLL